MWGRGEDAWFLKKPPLPNPLLHKKRGGEGTLSATSTSSARECFPQHAFLLT